MKTVPPPKPALPQAARVSGRGAFALLIRALRAAFAPAILALGLSAQSLPAQEAREQALQEQDAREQDTQEQGGEQDTQEQGAGEVRELNPSGFRDRLSWAVHGTLLLFPEENGPNRGGPAPILPSPGASLACRFWGPFSADASLDLYFTHYAYDFELDRAVPVEAENRSAFVFGPILGLSLTGRIPLGERFSVRLSGGLAMDLRIVMPAFGLNDADLAENDPRGAPMQVEALRDYFWDQGRWLLPVLGAGFDTALNGKFTLGIDFRLWFPLYRLWTGEDLPGLEGWRFGPGFRITVR
ncbi:MAG: hypothetical protein LBH26_07295 [Treponema sp.]|jgi:hypothetical protein|nr:hypothetical protein [Treponema sp.]